MRLRISRFPVWVRQWAFQETRWRPVDDYDPQASAQGVWQHRAHAEGSSDRYKQYVTGKVEHFED